MDEFAHSFDVGPVEHSDLTPSPPGTRRRNRAQFFEKNLPSFGTVLAASWARNYFVDGVAEAG